MKYICLNCDKEIDEIEILSNEEGWDICPYCEHNDLEPKENEYIIITKLY